MLSTWLHWIAFNEAQRRWGSGTLAPARRRPPEWDPRRAPAWLAAQLADDPSVTFHLKHAVIADLPATATVITDPDARRPILSQFVREFNERSTQDSPWPRAVPDEWMQGSPARTGRLSRRRLRAAGLAGAPARTWVRRFGSIDAIA